MEGRKGDWRRSVGSAEEDHEMPFLRRDIDIHDLYEHRYFGSRFLGGRGKGAGEQKS